MRGFTIMLQHSPDQLFKNTARLHSKESPILPLNARLKTTLQEAMDLREVSGPVRASLFLIPRFYQDAVRDAIPTIKERDLALLMRIHGLIKERFTGRRRSGEASSGHPIAVSLTLAGELGQADPRLIAYGLLHDYVEDVLWKDDYLKWRNRQDLINYDGKRDNDLHSHRRMFAIKELKSLKKSHGIGLDENDISIILALSIDKGHGPFYRTQIEGLRPITATIQHGKRARLETRIWMQEAAAKVRIADKIANLRSGELDLETSPQAQRRLLKQALAGYAHIVPLARHIINKQEQAELLSRLIGIIRDTISLVISYARIDERWWPTFNLKSNVEVMLNKSIEHILHDDQRHAYTRNSAIEGYIQTVLKDL